MASSPVNEFLRSHYGTAVSSGTVSRFANIGFSGAEIYRVQTGTGNFCLRRWPPGTMSGERLREIHGFLSFQSRGGLNVVPVPVQSITGCTFVESHGTLWQLEPWMPGEATYHRHPSTEKLDSAMAALARLHHMAEISRKHPGSVERSAGTPQTILERLRILNATRNDLNRIHKGLPGERDSRFHAVARRIVSHFERSSDGIEAALRSVAQLRVPVFPCLRDLRHDHLLFSGETLTGLVDFGALRTDTAAADLSRIAGSLFQSRWIDDPIRWNRAIGAYESVRPLTDSERQLIPVLDESGVLLSGTHWLRARYIHSSALDLPRICNRLESIVSRLETGPVQN